MIDDGFQKRGAAGLEQAHHRHKNKGYGEESAVGFEILEKYAEVFHYCASAEAQAINQRLYVRGIHRQARL